MNILHISPNFNYSCGVSKYLTIIFPELLKYPEVKLYFITNGGDSLERLNKIGIKPVLLKFNQGYRNIFSLKRNLNELGDFCLQNKIEVIHTHHRYPEFLANLLKRKLNIKTVTTVHSLVKGLKIWSFKSDKIIAVSKAVEENLLRNYNLFREKIIQLYNPINFDEFNDYDKIPFLKFNLGLPEASKVFLFIGRWTKLKGCDFLIKGFTGLFNLYKDLFLLIIADIPEAEKQKIQRHDKRIIIISPQKDIYKFYKIADAVVLPSRIESFPFVMLEAGLYKKLFLGSKVGGIAEFIEDGFNGLLFNLNHEAFINTIQKAINLSIEEKNFLTENLFNKVKQLDNPSTYVERLMNIYTDKV